MDLTGSHTEQSRERDGDKSRISTPSEASSRAPNAWLDRRQPGRVAVRDGLTSVDSSVGGRFFWSAGLVRDYPPDSMSPSGTARGMGSSAGYSAYLQGTPGNGFPTAAPQGMMGYQYPTADYGQRGSRQTQNFGGMYEQTNAAATSSPQAQTTSASIPQAYPAGSKPAIGGLTPAPGVRREEECPAAASLGEAYTLYQSALKETFQNIRDGVLATAGDSLLAASHWLLSHVVELGLASDDPNLHDERTKLWKNFNHAWLAMFQRQKDMMESGQQLQAGQALVSQEGLKKMGKDLVSLCDSIERHGLVDYQHGVWEEQIIAILEECLDLYDASSLVFLRRA